MQVIQTSDILKTAWEAAKKNFWFLWGAVIIVVLVNGVFQVITKTVGENTTQGYMIGFVSFLVSMFLQVGVVQMFLRLSENKNAEYSQMLDGSKFFWRYVLGTILQMLIVFVGFILLIIPGIIWGIKYSQWNFLLVDKDLSVIESFKKSAEITQGSKMDIFVVGLALFGIFILSAIPLGLGLIATIPLAMMASVYIYQKLRNAKEGTTVEKISGEEHASTETLTPFVPL